MNENRNPLFELGHELPFQSADPSASDQPLVRAGDTLLVTAQVVGHSDDAPSPGVWGGKVLDELDTPPAAGSGGDIPGPPDDKLVPVPGEEPEEPDAHTTLAKQVDDLEGLIFAALAKVRDLNEQATTVVSDPEQAAALRNRTKTISESLGGVATTIVEVREVGGLVERQEISWDDPELLANLGVDIRGLRDENNEYFNRGLNVLWRNEINTVGKALLAGELGLLELRNIGPGRMSELRHALAQHVPEIPLLQSSNPMLAARLYASAGETPLVVVHPSNKALIALRREGFSKLSVRDLLETDVFDEGLRDKFWDSRGPIQEYTDELREKTVAFVTAFNEAKQPLT